MGKFIFGLIIGILLVPTGFYFYLKSGHAPVATSAPPMPFENFFAKTALHATLQREAPKTQSTRADEAVLLAGADVYRHHCEGCHGLPGRPMSPAAKGMFPHPPQLLEQGQMVTDDPAGVTYWKAKNGIRLSGMPAFRASLSDDQLWQVSLFLAHADKLSPAVQQALEASPQHANQAQPSQQAPQPPAKSNKRQ